MVSNYGSMPPSASPRSYAAGATGLTTPRVARAGTPDSFDFTTPRFESHTSQKANQPKFAGAGGAAIGAMTGGVIGGVAAAMIGFPSLVLGFLPFMHWLWAVALASPLLIPAGMAIGALIGKGGKK